MLRAEREPNDGDLIWDRYAKRHLREERFYVQNNKQDLGTHGRLFIEIIRRVSALTGGVAAAPPTYHLFNRLLEMTR